ncbi:hypothetical protein ACPWSR_10170 [Alloiococcus sp. CFN-8]|uniref:hypothetical protein n=1 Tax=Alloiococcus sp. CFN-8 TaxID=3416081 RepID=UPI003CF8E8C6
MFNKNKSLLLIVLIICLFFTGCSYVDKANTWLKLKNEDFEYLKDGNVEEIVIQSTRDVGFRFIVTDKRTIKDLYSLLSSGKIVEDKSDLQPDYIFEIHQSSDKVYTFNYVAGLGGNEGNFYNDEKIYRVNKRLDNDIISNMSYLRKPRDFNDIYYGSILSVLSKYGSEINPEGKRIGVNLSDDLDCAKYILSADLEDFKYDLKNTMKNGELIDGNNKEYPIVLTVKTEGYKTNVYKSILTLYNNEDGSEKEYYVRGDHENRSWDIKIFQEKPSDW